MGIGQQIREAKAKDQSLSHSKISKMFGVGKGTVQRSLSNKDYEPSPSRTGYKRPEVKLKGVKMQESGPSGFAELFNYRKQVERKRERVAGMINKCVDSNLRRKAFLDAGGSEDNPKCPAGWFYDSEGPKLAGVTGTDWREFRDEWGDCQLTVTTDGTKSSERLVWVDPDDVDTYREALEA